MKPTINPINDFVIVQPAEVSNTIGDLVIGTASKSSPDRGTVIAVGPGRYDSGIFIPTTVKVGDSVIFAPNSGAYVKLGDDVDEILVLVEGNIIGVVTQ